MATETSLNNAYTYNALDDREIRIIRLQPGDEDSIIFVEISKTKIPSPDLLFTALSWEWGKPSDDKPQIRIRNRGLESDTSWHRMNVPQNLYRALKRLRQSDDEVLLWVDAICIDQENDKGPESEKSKQISMMTSIYTEAESVTVWLGEPGQGENTDITEKDVIEAVNYIEDVGNLDGLDHIASVDKGILDKATSHNLQPVFKFFRRGWFSRRWEIALARVATLQCGSKTVSWERFAHSVALLERVGRDGTISRILKRQPATGHISEYAGNISALPAYRLVQNTSELFSERGGFRFKERTLEQLVCFLAAFKASRAQDTIYAILGLAVDFEPAITSSSETTPQDGPTKFSVNYADEPLVVFKRFLDASITKSKSLDILCRPWAPLKHFKDGKVEMIDLPSWISSLARKPYQPDKNGKMYRYNPDPLVGVAIPRMKFFQASGSGLRHNEQGFFKIHMERNSKTIEVKGCFLGTIESTWDSAVHGNIPASWLRAAKWNKDEEMPPEEFWRTMVANRTNEGNHPEPWYPRAFHSAIREKESRYGINTHQLIHEKDNAAYSEVFSRVQAVVWDRRLIQLSKVERGGASWHPLGLAPEEAQKGDEVYIVLGCSVPLVLSHNSFGQKSDQADHKRRLVGECYIDSMMDGQAFNEETTWTNLKIE
ncbi:heterokaryon incompatibility protein-domain-containing protein [Fusarium oxysporum]|nr:heterokaryon incompatibility protein-domain-containing protein [Fusarium oxysporum]